MEPLVNKSTTALTVLEGLATEARYYSSSAVTSIIQLGRVLVEAKNLVKHGEWSKWIMENAGCSERYAQQFMQVYTRFGNNPAISNVGERSKLFKMLALPLGAEKDFLEQTDINTLSSREVSAEVRKYKERAESAEAQVEVLKKRPPEIPEDISETLSEKDALIEKQATELGRVADAGRETISEVSKLRSENASLLSELKENEALLSETQQECVRVQNEFLNSQSAFAKGDAERVPSDTLTEDAFATAVQQFIGTCARMPQMGRTFSVMRHEEREPYDELLRTIEDWMHGARRALSTISEEEIEV